MKSKSTNQRRVTSLLVLLALSLGVAAIDYHFCRDKPLTPLHTSHEVNTMPRENSASL